MIRPNRVSGRSRPATGRTRWFVEILQRSLAKRQQSVRNLRSGERDISMDHMFDEVARILASPMPRRQAFRLLGGALVGGIVAALGVERASGRPPACSPPCGAGKQCCGNTCRPSTETCCGNTSCRSDQQCCGGSTCRPSTETCCGTTGLSCKSTTPCCTTVTPPFCVTPKK